LRILACLVIVLAYAEDPPPLQFVNAAKQAGIGFRHENAATPEKYLIETMGAGAAWLDYDNDGLLDAYLVNSSQTRAYKPQTPLRSALYRSNGDGTFTDVTNSTGVSAEGLFGMGAAVADFDNDGDQDLYVVGFDRSILYRNEGNGRFSDITGQAGTANRSRWGSSAAWLDYDRDGWLDLVVANYVDWRPESNIFCGEQRLGYRSYCHPNKYRGQPPTLYRNNRDGTFTDVSTKSGISAKAGNGLGVVCFDFNRDGWPDIFIANDSMANFLFVNRGNGKFDERAVDAGVAFGENGEIEAGMGVDAADFDGDGWDDLFVTHLDMEMNRAYRNTGKGSFEDVTFRTGLGHQAFHLSGFGTGFVDVDNDGLRDIFVVNGHVLDNIALFHPKTTHAEPKALYRNTGTKFIGVAPQLGTELIQPRVGRAAAFADYDNDGDFDVLVSNNGQEAELLRNDGGNRNHWLQVFLIGTKSNRDGVGARVTLMSGNRNFHAERKAGFGYQSAHDPRLHFGLGPLTKAEAIEVVWPSGVVDHLGPIDVDRVLTIEEGKGRGERAFPKILSAVTASPALDRTIAEYLEALRRQPDLQPAKYALIGSCRQRTDPTGAEQLLQQIVDQSPDFSEARYNLGLILKAQEQIAPAIEQFRAAARLDPFSPKAFLALGSTLAEQQQIAEAIPTLRRAIELAPKNPDGPYNLGLAFALGGQPKEAAEAFRGALNLDTRHAQSRRALGITLMHENDLEGAVRELLAATERSPGDAEAYTNLGMAFLRLNDFGDAIAALERAVQVNPSLIKASATLAQAYQRAGRLSDARKATDRAASLTREQRDLGRALVLVQSAQQKLAAGDSTSAIAQLREAIKVSPQLVVAHQQLGKSLRDAGDLQGAFTALEGARALNPKMASIRYDIGLTLDRAGKPKEALSELGLAAAMAPCSAEFRQALGVAELEAGYRVAGTADLEIAMALDPQNQRIRRMLESEVGKVP